MTLGDLNIRLLLEIVQADKAANKFSASVKEVTAETDKATASAKKLETQSVTLSEKLQNVGLRFMGIQSVVTALQSTFGQLIREYNGQEIALSKLSNGLKNVGEGTAALNKLTTQASELQKITPFADEEINNAQAMLTTFMKSGQEIEILTPRILDLAAAYQKSGESGMDLQQIAVMLGKVNEDTVGALKRVGVAFTKEQEEKLKSTKGTEQAIILSQILDQNFKGMAETVGNTAAGKMKIFDNRVGEMKESLGKLLADALIPMLSTLGPLIDSIANGSEPVKRLTLGVIALAAAFVVLGTSLGGIPYAIGAVIAILYALNTAQGFTIEKMRQMGQESLKTQQISEGMKKILGELKISANNTADAYDKISESLFGMSKAQLENARASIEAEILRVKGQQLMMVANQPDDPAEFMQQQAPFMESITKLNGLLGEITNRLNSVRSFSSDKSGTDKGSSTTGTSAKDKQAELDYLAQLKKELDEINAKIAKQTTGESTAEGLFIKKRSIESEIELIKAVNTNFAEYLKLRSQVATMPTDLKSGISIIPEDEIMKFKILLEQQKRARQEMERSYDKLVSDLSAASSIVSSLSQALEEGGKGFLYWINAALQAALQVASLIKKGNSDEGLGFGDILGAIGTILPFFLASGGYVPGSGSGDTVPAMLTPGEYVLNKSAVSRFGTNMLNWLNGGGSVVSSMPQTSLAGGSNNIVINLMGELTDQLTHKIYSRGNTIVNVRKKGSSF